MDGADVAATTGPQGQQPAAENMAGNDNTIRSTNSSGLFSDSQFARSLVIGFNSVSIGTARPHGWTRRQKLPLART
ncbi:hypothetical protein [Agrobacterium sp. RS6]|uniref:hypothetical protein n=1 Tax=Agrobacterium sp. RS6 TaxID=2489001 RepID=UPI001FE0B929|nr:hypothetical protein [Agrobacterium sp. RS6]